MIDIACEQAGVISLSVEPVRSQWPAEKQLVMLWREPRKRNSIMTNKRQKIDYDRIECGWRAGILSPRQLMTQYTEETNEPVSHLCNHQAFYKARHPSKPCGKDQSQV